MLENFTQLTPEQQLICETFMPLETDPNLLSPHEPGAKLDAGKPRTGLVMLNFAYALQAVAEVGTFGARKYSDNGWKRVPAGVDRYTDALLRHLLAEGAGDPVDEDSGLLHAAHCAWNALARLELMLNTTLEKA